MESQTANPEAGNIDQAIPGATFEQSRAEGAALPTRKIAMGEELPIFCEQCGYALHGLPQRVCGACAIRHFHCPECGHHQPINTLRPAAQRILGRLRALALGVSVFLKLNFFGWLLFAWVAMGHAWSYQYRYTAYTRPSPRGYVSDRYMPRELDTQQIVSFILFALAFSMLGRMFLLRWRRGYVVGLTLSALVCTAVAGGALWRMTSRNYDGAVAASPFTGDFLTCLALTAGTLTLGATAVWGIWSALAHVFLPRRTAEALLDWQRSQSDRPAALLGRAE